MLGAALAALYDNGGAARRASISASVSIGGPCGWTRGGSFMIDDDAEGASMSIACASMLV